MYIFMIHVENPKRIKGKEPQIRLNVSIVA